MAEPQNNKVIIPLHRPGVREQFFFFLSGIIMSIPLTLLAEQLSSSLVSINLPELYALILSIATGLAFTLYTDPFGITNAIGHFLQIASFILIYLAFVETILTKPQDILYRNRIYLNIL